MPQYLRQELGNSAIFGAAPFPKSEQIEIHFTRKLPQKGFLAGFASFNPGLRQKVRHELAHRMARFLPLASAPDVSRTRRPGREIHLFQGVAKVLRGADGSETVAADLSLLDSSYRRAINIRPKAAS